MRREEKEKVVAELSARLSESEAIILTDFKGLNVGAMGALRRKVAESEADYRVVKNTLLRLAAKGTEAEKLEELFLGNTAVSTTDTDPVALAKALIGFAKENDRLIVKGGVVSGQILDLGQIKELADLPSREVLLSMMLGAMNAVPASLVRLLAAVMQKFVYSLAAIRDQKEQAAA